MSSVWLLFRVMICIGKLIVLNELSWLTISGMSSFWHYLQNIIIMGCKILSNMALCRTNISVNKFIFGSIKAATRHFPVYCRFKKSGYTKYFLFSQMWLKKVFAVDNICFSFLQYNNNIFFSSIWTVQFIVPCAICCQFCQINHCKLAYPLCNYSFNVKW